MRRIGLTLFFIAALSTAAMAQDDHHDNLAVMSGYAVVTVTNGLNPGDGIEGRLAVFETFGWRSQVPALQAAVLPATLTTRMVLPASRDVLLGRDVGVGITNPGGTEASVMFTLRDAAGIVVGNKSIFVGARRQTAQFVGEFFLDGPDILNNGLNIPNAFDGTLTLTSSSPVAIVALRFTGTKFTTMPITSLSAPAGLPTLAANVGGNTGVLLPVFAAEGRWASEIVVLNNTATSVTVRIDLFKQDSTPLVTTLNHVTGSTFQNLVIPARGIIMFSPRNANGDSDF